MSSYSKELAPWERKSASYSAIQLGKDVKTQTKAINKQTEALLAAQIASTSAIISSQERISEGIDNVAYGVERVEEGMYGLKAAFEWGISEVVWQIEQNRHVLEGILAVLMAPLNTQAKELRRRAEDAYANGWFEDALEDFLESEKKNKYDFLVHISIGMINLFQKIDKEKAFEYFEKAIRYAKPKSPYHASFALLYKALIKRDLGHIEEAEKCTDEAVGLCPDFAEALYQNAQYNALLNKPAKAIPLLKKAIEMDINYCEKIQNESAFDKIRTQVNAMFEELRDEQKQKARAEYETLAEKLKAFNNLVNEIKNQEPMEIDDFAINKYKRRVTELMRRNSYRDYLEANTILENLYVLQKKLNSDIKTRLEKIINNYNSSIIEIEHDKNCRINKSLDNIGLVWGIGIPVSIFLLGFVGCLVGASLIDPRVPTPQPAKFYSGFFGVPVCGIIITAIIYFALYFTIKSRGQATTPETIHIESSTKHLQGILSELERM